MNRQQISWAMYIVGSLLVFGSWVNLVPPGLGWLGWLAALAGWGIGTFSDKQKAPLTYQSAPPPSKADEIAKLSLLHQEGIISEDEFQLEKRRILH